ncbi:MAG: DUF692 family protein [Alphaproteobacteria bacterium]|nr:DUF692 family protein [Alphaproteobacteria bacterium]
MNTQDKKAEKPFALFSGPDAALSSGRTGIGLRAPHAAQIIAGKPEAGFLEAHSENYFCIGGVPFEQLMACREDYPVSLHGVGLSLGAAEGVDDAHLQKLKALADIVQPVLMSEHVSWSRAAGVAVPDLLPLPMTQEALAAICRNIEHVQETLGRAILVENPSSYMEFEGMEMNEPEMIARIIERTGCGLLLDVNNIYVSAHNLGFDAKAYLDAIPQGIVGEIHLAGYHVNEVAGDDVFIDAHNNPVYDPVWDLYEAALARFGDIPTLIEWDSDLPVLSRLLEEAQKADEYRAALRKDKGTKNARVA